MTAHCAAMEVPLTVAVTVPPPTDTAVTTPCSVTVTLSPALVHSASNQTLSLTDSMPITLAVIVA